MTKAVNCPILFVMVFGMFMSNCFVDGSGFNAEPTEILAIQIEDRSGALRVHFIDEGTYKIHCRCRRKNLVEIVDESGASKSAERCNPYSYSASISINVESLPLGEYYCKYNNYTESRGISSIYKLCHPLSDACRLPCDDNDQRFCVVTKDHPEGAPCATPPKTNKSEWLPDIFQIHYCPGNYKTFSDATMAGFQNIDFLMETNCPTADESIGYVINGQKLHYYQSIVVTDRNATFAATCPKVVISRAVFLKLTAMRRGVFVTYKDTLILNATGCFNEVTLNISAMTLRDDLVPQRVSLLFYVGYDEFKMQTRAYLILFMQDFKLELRNEVDRAVITVKLPNYRIDPEFEFDVSAVLRAKSGLKYRLLVNGLEVLVTRPGNVTVTLSQIYISCSPHAIHYGDPLTKSISVDNLVDAKSDKDVLLIEEYPGFIFNDTNVTGGFNLNLISPWMVAAICASAALRNVISVASSTFIRVGLLLPLFTYR